MSVATQEAPAAATSQDSLVQVRNLKMHFPVTEGAIVPRVVAHVKAVDGISFDIRKGETLGLVGESGCGKTTTGRCILQLENATDGEIIYDGHDLMKLDKKAMRPLRQRIQVIFQDPYSSLNPRMKIGDIISEPMMVHQTEPDKAARDSRVRELLSVCGLNPHFADRYPHEMSGGQRQRVGIARALAVKPEFIICDEAVSALDVSIQAQVINLLEELRDQFDLTYLFISHDLSVVRHLCQRVAVMYLGTIVEMAETDELFDNPLHPYTKALLEAVPIPDPTVEAQRAHQVIEGEIPSPINPPSGCVFHPRGATLPWTPARATCPSSARSSRDTGPSARRYSRLAGSLAARFNGAAVVKETQPKTRISTRPTISTVKCATNSHSKWEDRMKRQTFKNRHRRPPPRRRWCSVPPPAPWHRSGVAS